MKTITKIIFALFLSTTMLGGCGGSGESSTSGEDPESLVYSTSSLLERLQASKNISLQVDIDLADVEWPTNIEYKGVFKGNGHKISNLNIKTLTQQSSVGFLSKNSGTIENLKFEDAQIEIRTEGSDCGILVGQNSGSIKDVTATGKIVASAYSSVGGLIGWTTANVSNLTTSVDVEGRNRVGGVVGSWTSKEGKLESLVNNGVVNGVELVGGVLGLMTNDAGSDWKIATLSNCTNNGEVNGTKCVGGILGQNYNQRSDYGTSYGSIKLLYNENNAKVTATGDCAGGIAGEAAPENIDNCKNTADVTGSSRVAGIIGNRPHYGYFECDYFYATNCSNEGKITSTGTGGYTGGLFGRGCGRVNKCTNYGEVKTLINSKFTGGIAGTFEIGGKPDDPKLYTIENDAKVYDLVNKGTISGYDSTGGIFGDVGGRDNWYTVSNLKNEGIISGSDGVGGIFGGITDGYQPYGPGTPAWSGGMKIKALYCDNLAAVSGQNNVYGIVGKYYDGRLDTNTQDKGTNLNDGTITAVGENYGPIYR